MNGESRKCHGYPAKGQPRQQAKQETAQPIKSRSAKHLARGDEKNEAGNDGEVSAPKSFRFLGDAVEPFESVALDPYRRLFDAPA